MGTVIFIKSCCVNHDENEDDIKERRQVDKDKTALESQSTVVETMEVSQLINEHNLSHKNLQQHLKMISTSEELISYKKRQKSKKKHRKSKQKQEMLDLLNSLNHANEMASKLKKRSEDILDTLETEIKEFQKQPITN